MPHRNMSFLRNIVTIVFKNNHKAKIIS